MRNDTLKSNSKYIIPVLIIAGFILYFTYDIYTLKKAFTHPDLITCYYSFRQWFSSRLLNGEFPMWNPFWGLGVPSDIWATIPIDIYTILEIIFGPKYHYFQVIQLTLILYAGFYAFLKFGFKPMVSAAGAILYFMMPWVTYFYFYFVKPHSFVAIILLFVFICQWSKTEDIKYLFFINWTIIFSMFGTKPEYWFVQTVFCVFYAIMAALVFNPHKYLHAIKIFSISIVFIFAGLAAHLWQLNIIGRIISDSGRSVDHNILNVFSYEMYHNLFLSITESSLLKMLCAGCLLYLGIDMKKRFSRLFLFIGIIMFFKLKIWRFTEIAAFINSPYAQGAVIGMLFLFLRCMFSSPFSFITVIKFFQDQLKTCALFLLIIYYWCRPGVLSEAQIIALAPALFKILLSALVWLGCAQFWKNILVKLAYFSILFMFLIREHGQILLVYLTGMVWMPTRDNYIIDFAVAVLAAAGLSILDIPNILESKLKRINITFPASFVSIGIIVFSASSNFYYSHMFMERSPPDYPYYTGIPKLKKVIHELHDSPATRVYFIRDDPLSQTYSIGTTLLEGISQVTLYSSTIPKRYRDWAIYRELGIRPEENWGCYPDGYTEKMISKLPKMNTLGYPNGPIYYYTVLARPPVDKNILRLLGIKYIARIFHKSDETAYTLDPKTWTTKSEQPIDIYIEGLVKGLDLKNVKVTKIKEFVHYGKEGLLLIAMLDNPLPRVFLAAGISEESIGEFMSEMNPLLIDDADIVKTKSFEFSLKRSAIIEKYEPEAVSVTVEAEDDAYLVLSDLYHPFWHAKVDGKTADIIPAFYILRAVKVPKGNHRVDFYCKIPYFNHSIVISLLMILLSFGSFLVYKRRDLWNR